MSHSPQRKATGRTLSPLELAVTLEGSAASSPLPPRPQAEHCWPASQGTRPHPASHRCAAPAPCVTTRSVTVHVVFTWAEAQGLCGPSPH